LSDLWKKAMEFKMREKVRPFEAPDMQTLLRDCAQAHELRRWDKIDSAKDPFRHSLFLIKSGIIKLRRGPDVHRILLAGDCFSEDDFAKETVSGQYVAEAWSTSVVLQLSRDKVGKYVEQDPELSARFYHAVCLVIEQGLREAQEDTFPGTWNRKVVAHTGMHEEEQQLAQASKLRKKKEGGWKAVRHIPGFGRAATSEGRRKAGSNRQLTQQGASGRHHHHHHHQSHGAKGGAHHRLLKQAEHPEDAAPIQVQVI